MVAMYRLTVAGFLAAFTSCSMNARIVAGSAGKNDSPLSTSVFYVQSFTVWTTSRFHFKAA
jgi:hypothetical protein